MTIETTVEKVKKVVNAPDCERCYASKARQTIVDVIHPVTGLSWYAGKTLEQIKERYPDAEEMSVEEFCAWKAAQQRTPIEWTPTTEEQYNDMLEVLPPALWLRGGFLIGEPTDHDAGNGQARYEAYRRIDGGYMVASRPMTTAEFRAELGSKRETEPRQLAIA